MELTFLPPMPRVDIAKIFSLLPCVGRQFQISEFADYVNFVALDGGGVGPGRVKT